MQTAEECSASRSAEARALHADHTTARDVKASSTQDLHSAVWQALDQVLP